MREIVQRIRLSEWDTREVKNCELMEDDRRLVEELARKPQCRLVIDEFKDRTLVRTTSWVGIVRLSKFEIEVVPKLAGANLGVLEMIEQTSGLDALWRSSSLRDIDVEGTNLYDLFVLLLVEECERILRSGVLADYVEEEDALSVLRGRLLLDRQIRQRYGQVDKVICRYDDYHQNIRENQILAYALNHCANRVCQPSIAKRVRQVGIIFREVCDWSNLDPTHCWEELTYHRLNEHYRPAHELARIVVEASGLTSLYTAGAVNCFSFLIDMNVLFERFVLRVLRSAVKSLEVRYQHVETSVLWDALAKLPYGRIVPDFVLSDFVTGKIRLALDAKYKLYDDRKVDPGDLYQTFIYSYAFSEGTELPRSVLIYPSENLGGLESHLHVRTMSRIPKASVFLVSVNIPLFLTELKSGAIGPAITSIGKLIVDQIAPE